MAPVWLNCNICRRTGSQVMARLNMTNCGLIFCTDCTASLSKRVCRACRGKCKRSVRLNRQAPREVRSLFESFETKIKNLERSSAFQARQMRSLFGRFYDLGSHYKGKMKKYQEAKEVNHRRKTNLVDKLDESVRRKAFLEGRKEHLLTASVDHVVYSAGESMKGTRKKEEYDVRGFFASSFMSLASTTKIRRTETSRTFEGRSSFQDSGVSDILSGDLTPKDKLGLETHCSGREKRSPALQYLLQMSQVKEDSNLRPVTSSDKKKYNFFSSLK